MRDNPFDTYTHTVCESNGDGPDWFFYAACALPFALLILGCIGG